jgi:glycosyltransferase involved in cell wall biosynthesis
LLVVSHPAVVAVNQLPYAELRRHDWDPFVVVPSRWRTAFTSSAFSHEVLPELAGRVVGRRVLLPGRHQRHVYVTRLARLIALVRPTIAFIEEEPTSAPGFQWARALARAGVPFGLQADENLDRAWPLPARVFRRWTLARAAFVAARSPAAAALIRRHRPDMSAPVIPHQVPSWAAVARGSHDKFVVGYAGRLVPEKGLDDLLAAAAGIDGIALRLVGNGPHRAALEARSAALGIDLTIDTGRKHEQMSAAYASFDVLVLPSRTTATWAEQFGRVMVEALSCGVPVVGSTSGEIPWVVEVTGGGLLFAERDARALREAILRLRDSPALRRELAERGRERARAEFSVEAVGLALDRALRDALASARSTGRR